MDSDELVYVTVLLSLAVLGRKYLCSIGQQKIWLKNSVAGKVIGTDTEFLVLSYVQLIESCY